MHETVINKAPEQQPLQVAKRMNKEFLSTKKKEKKKLRKERTLDRSFCGAQKAALRIKVGTKWEDFL